MKWYKCGGHLREVDLTASDVDEYIGEDMYHMVYACPRCKTLFICKSQSGDFVEEQLEEVGMIDE